MEDISVPPPDSPTSDDDPPPITTIVHSCHALHVGDSFASYELLEQRLKRHTAADFVTYWRRDTRTVRGALMKTSRPIAQRLRYYSVRYACVHGGQKFDRRGIGQRQKRSMRRNCPAHITLRASKCGDFLEVTDACNEHNHTVSAEDARQLPQNRRLSPAVRSEVAEMLLLNIDHRTILEYVRVAIGIPMTSKEMTNLRQALCVGGVPLAAKSTSSSSSARRSELLARLEANGCTKRTNQRRRTKTPPPTPAVCADQPPTASIDYLVSSTSAAGPPSPLTDEPAVLINGMLADDDVYYESIAEDNLIEYDLHSSSECDDTDAGALRLESVEMPDEVQSPMVEHTPAMDALFPTEEYLVNSNKFEEQADQMQMPVEDNIVVIIDDASASQQSANTDSHLEPTDTPQPIAVKRYRPAKPRRAALCGCRCARGHLLRAQIAVLRAEKRKLIEETQILRLTKQRLLAENVLAIG